MRLCLIVIALVLSATTQDQIQPKGDHFHSFEKASAFDSHSTKQTDNARKGSGFFLQNQAKNSPTVAALAKDITISDLAALEK